MERYEEYKDSDVEWIGEIPKHWGFEKTKSLCDRDKRVIQVKDFKGQSVVHYSIPNVQEFGRGVVEPGEEIDSSKLLLSGGEVLISKLNPRKGCVAKVASSNDHTLLGSGEFIPLIPRSGLNVDFFFNFVQSPRYSEYLDSNVESVTRSHQRVSPDVIYDLRVPLPPLHEQEQIVAYLDEKTTLIDDLIAKTERKIALLKEKRTALINQAVTKGLDPNIELKDSGVEWIGEIPRHWSLTKLKRHGAVIIGLSYKPDNIVDEDAGILVMRSSNVQNGRATFTDNVYVNCDIPEKLITREGDIVICSRNGSRRLIGKNCLIDTESAGHTWGVFMSVYRSRDPQFFRWLLNSPVFESQSGLYLTSTINQLTVSTLENLIVPYTDDPIERRRIVTYLDKQTRVIDLTITNEDMRIKLLKEYRQSLISEVVTGKVKVISDD